MLTEVVCILNLDPPFPSHANVPQWFSHMYSGEFHPAAADSPRTMRLLNMPRDIGATSKVQLPYTTHRLSPYTKPLSLVIKASLGSNQAGQSNSNLGIYTDHCYRNNNYFSLSLLGSRPERYRGGRLQKTAPFSLQIQQGTIHQRHPIYSGLIHK